MKTKEQKQAEAAERRIAHEARTPEEQMRLILDRPGTSARERTKLVVALNNGQGKLPRKKVKKEGTK